MCRNIRTLRAPYAETVSDTDIRAAALQYVRKVSGFRQPAAHNTAAFDRAVDAVEAATAELLSSLEVRGHPGGVSPTSG
ncbi:DUF2277 domain-containing protein [Saccharomonospora iraqiensis]|uniref:DUF2277 domain-containing protein n=1 Tax=Saccharomonospora iraqiensis TaxID=52698 RepID=UPI00022E5A28|nr:DUF2277 domain-containing protein [Saccharomonospora iraqiensis]